MFTLKTRSCRWFIYVA